MMSANGQAGEGLFVVADIANLPFKPGVFDLVVSLHTIHHLPVEEHVRAYGELYRVLAQGCTAVVVNGWGSSPLKTLAEGMVRFVDWLRAKPGSKPTRGSEQANSPLEATPPPRGTFVRKHNVAWLECEIGGQMPLQIYVWRTFGVQFLRTFIHPRLAGGGLLRLLYWLEERFPRFLGRNGQYPLIVMRKE